MSMVLLERKQVEARATNRWKSLRRAHEIGWGVSAQRLELNLIEDVGFLLLRYAAVLLIHGDVAVLRI
jgi:hypothetical protein